MLRPRLPPLQRRDVPMLLPSRPTLLLIQGIHVHDGDESARVLVDEDVDEKPHEKPNGDDGVVVAAERSSPGDTPLPFLAFLVPSLITLCYLLSKLLFTLFNQDNTLFTIRTRISPRICLDRMFVLKFRAFIVHPLSIIVFIHLLIKFNSRLFSKVYQQLLNNAFSTGPH